MLRAELAVALQAHKLSTTPSPVPSTHGKPEADERKKLQSIVSTRIWRSYGTLSRPSPPPDVISTSGRAAHDEHDVRISVRVSFSFLSHCFYMKAKIVCKI